MLSALGTEVLRRGLIDVEVAILGAQLALARASLAVAEVAGVALRQSVRVPSTHRDTLYSQVHKVL